MTRYPFLIILLDHYIKMQKVNLQINLKINYNYQKLITSKYKIHNKNNMMKYHPIFRNYK